MNSDLLALFFVLLALIAVIVVFVRTALRIRRNGSSYSTIFFASTYDFYNKDKRNVIEVMSEQKAGNKMEEQSSDQPKE